MSISVSCFYFILFLCLVLQVTYGNGIPKSPDEETDPFKFLTWRSLLGRCGLLETESEFSTIFLVHLSRFVGFVLNHFLCAEMGGATAAT